MAQIIQLRRDYSSNWTLANPVLAQGELGIEFDNYNVKIGNGLSSWNELPYGLGTVSLSAHTHSYAGTGLTTASITGIDIAGTLNSNGLSLAIPAWLTTYNSAAGGGDWTAATVSGTDMLVSTGAGTNTIYYPKYITTAALSNHTHDYASSDHTHSQYQSTGNYLTTAALSDHTHTQYIETSVSFNFLTTALNTDYTSHGHTQYVDMSLTSQWLTTAALSSHIHSQYLTTAIDTNYTSHIHSQYLTTAAGIIHTHGTPSLSLVNMSGSVSSASDGLTLSLTGAAGDGGGADWSISSTAGTNILISTGASINTLYQPSYITTYAAGGGQIAISAGGSSNDLASVVFSNSNGVGFGLNGSTITASYSQSTHEHPYIGSASTSVFAYTSNSSLLQHTSATSAITSAAVNTSVTSQWLTTAALSNHTHSNLYINTSVSGSFQLTSDNSLFLGTGYTTHTHQYQSTGNYLTTAALSDHTHSNLYIALGNSTAYATSVLSNTFQTTGAYLTTAMQSGSSSAFIGTGGSTTASTAGSDLKITMTNAGLNFGVPKWLTTAMLSENTSLYQSTGAYLTTAAQSNQVVNSINGSTGVFTFGTGSSLSSSRNGNSITWGLASNITSALQSAGAYLTTAMASANTSLFVYTSASSLFQHTSATSAITASALNTSQSSLLQHTSATSSITANAINTSVSGSFQLTANNSLSLDTGYTTHTHTYAVTNHTHSDLYIPLANSSAYQTATLANTFAQTANVMLTGERSNYFYTSNNTLANSTHTHGGLTINVTNLSTSITSASNGLTINLSAANPGAGGGVAVAAAGATITNNTVVFSNSNGVSFGGNGSTITAQIAGVGTVNFVDSNGITWGSSVNGAATTITASVNAGGGGTSIVPGAYLSSSLNGSTLSLSVTGLQATSATSAITASAMNTSERVNYFYTSNNTFVPLANTTNFAGVGETTAGAISLTVNTAGVNASVPAVGYLSLVNSAGYTWSTSVNGVSTAVWLVLA